MTTQLLNPIPLPPNLLKQVNSTGWLVIRQPVGPSDLYSKGRTLNPLRTKDRMALLESGPHGKVGDVLWVQEVFSHGPQTELSFKLDGSKALSSGWFSALNMPFWAARTFLEVTVVDLERLKDVQEKDVCSEGWGRNLTRDCKLPYFIRDWNERYASAGLDYETNPWVWKIIFKLTPKKDEWQV